MFTNILIVEDDALQALSIQNYIENETSRSFIAHSYGEALKSLQEHNFDIVILDINLKEEKSGIDLGNHIKDTMPQMAIIYITSYTDKQTLKRIAQTGAKSFLSKPIKKADLLAALNILEVQNSPKTLTLTVGKTSYTLNLDCIQYIESDHIYIKIFQKGRQKLIIRYTLTAFAAQVPPNFIRISRSVIVNQDYIEYQTTKTVSVGGQVFKRTKSPD